MIPNLPRSGNHLVDNYDDELEEERKEDEIDQADYQYGEDR
jgi:hypothetical protein